MTTFTTPDLSDAAPQVQALEMPLISYGAKTCFHGQVVTIKCHEDNTLLKATLGEPGAGRVIVVDGGGSRRRAILGDVLAAMGAKNGWAGLVLNGVIRDVDEVASIELGVQALGSCPLKGEKLRAGQRDVPVRVGGVLVVPGDYLYADHNGVILSKSALL